MMMAILFARDNRRLLYGNPKTVVRAALNLACSQKTNRQNAKELRFRHAHPAQPDTARRTGDEDQ